MQARLSRNWGKFLKGNIDGVSINGCSCSKNHKLVFWFPGGDCSSWCGHSKSSGWNKSYANFTRKITCSLLWLQVLLLGTTSSIMHKTVWTKSVLDCSWPVCLRKFLLQQMVMIFFFYPNIAKSQTYWKAHAHCMVTMCISLARIGLLKRSTGLVCICITNLTFGPESNTEWDLCGFFPAHPSKLDTEQI